MIDDTRTLSKGLAYTLAALSMFFAIGEFILLTLSNERPPHYNEFATYFIYLSGLLVVPVLMVLGARMSKFKLLAILWFHLFMSTLLLWFSEIVSPFTPTWSLLILFASIYYGWKGFIASSVNLIINTGIYIVLFPESLVPEAPIYIGIAIMINVITILNAYLFFRIIKNGKDKNVELWISRAAEKQRANQLSAVLNSIHDPVLTIDSDGMIVSQNAASQSFFETNESYVGRRVDAFVSLYSKDGGQILLSEYANNITNTLIRDDVVYGQGDERLYISLQVSRIERAVGEKSGGIVVVLHDITKQRTLDSEKDAFISVTSHELRIPIAAIESGIGNIKLLRSQGVADERLDKFVDDTSKQVTSLSQIVNDISIVSRVEQGVDEGVEEVDLRHLLQELHDKYADQAKQKSLSFTMQIQDNPPAFISSRLYLSAVIENIVKNAIEYTKVGSVTVKASVENGHLLCSVSDTGIGISESDQDKIFEKFYRSEDYRARDKSGTGLGLYIVKLLATKMNGTVRVDSHLNKGSTFYVSVPVTLVKEVPSEEADPASDQKDSLKP
jgi:two-component system, OmpR family, phosphate regulon sensor histidine kinase PhoR